MAQRSLVSLALGVIFFSLVSLSSTGCLAADSKPARTQKQVEVTIVHVDKYGVYAPNLIFYWDAEASKQKTASLSRIADQLRNKKATITYLVTDDKDKHPLLVDIAPYKETATPEPSKSVSQEASARKEVQTAAAPAEEKPVQPPPPEKPKPIAKEDLSKTEPFLPPRVEPTPPLVEPEGASDTLPISRDEVVRFIQTVLRMTEVKDINTILACYADQVNYYNRGTVNKDYIRKDIGYYFKNWDRINTAIEGNVVLIVTDQHDVRIVKFVSSYSVANSKKAVSGTAENIWQVQRIGRDLKIIDEKQRILSSETRPF